MSGFRQKDNYDDSAFTDLTSLKSNMLSYLRDLFTKKRTAASHILVFMIADELYNRKPYAIPVRFMPYKSITDSKLRELSLQVEEAMRNVGMTVVGMHYSCSVSSYSSYFIIISIIIIYYYYYIIVDVSYFQIEMQL